MEARVGLGVKLTGEGACSADVAVVIRDGDYSETLTCAVYDGQNCTCSGAIEREGTYEISVEKDDATVATETVEVHSTADGCHVEGESVEIDI